MSTPVAPATPLGWDGAWEAVFSAHAADGLSPARVVAEHRGSYEVLTAAGSGSGRRPGSPVGSATRRPARPTSRSSATG